MQITRAVCTNVYSWGFPEPDSSRLSEELSLHKSYPEALGQQQEGNVTWNFQKHKKLPGGTIPHGSHHNRFSLGYGIPLST